MNNLAIKHSLHSFLQEDLSLGDITSDILFDAAQTGKADFVAKETFVTAGIASLSREVFCLLNPHIQTTSLPDGTRTKKGDILFTAHGPVRDLLQGERVALNLAQRLSGIATLTNQFVQNIKPLPVKIVDTRKTTPGLRVLEKYAVRVGGGQNHRFNLSDGILIKDNHIAACGSITKAVGSIRQHAPHTLKIEVETENLDQVAECLSCDVEIIMLDNMTLSEMRKAVQLVGGRAIVEASGGVTLESVRDIAETGVDIISIGALTHSAPSADISMRLNV